MINKTKPTIVIEKPVLVPHCPRIISHDVTHDWNCGSAVSSQHWSRGWEGRGGGD